MRYLAILGAGDLGASLALSAAVGGTFGEIRLIDRNRSVASGKALDIQQAGAIDGFSATVEASDRFDDSAIANVVVLADQYGNPSIEWTGDAGFQILAEAARLNARGLFVCAGARQRDLIRRAVTELGLSRHRIIGSAPIAVASAARAFVAAELDRSAIEISTMVLGIPPAAAIVPWDRSTIGSSLLTDVMTAPQLARVRERLRRSWPPGPYALATAACRAAEAAVRSAHDALPCFVAVDRELGSRGAVVALPVLLGATGVREIVVPPLSTHDRVMLENAASLTT